MARYRIDFLCARGSMFATHEIEYASDKDAIAGGYLINGSPSIGRGFQVWRERELIHWHYNEQPISS